MIKTNPIPGAKIWTRPFILILAVSFLLFLSMYMLLPTLPIYAQTLGANETIAGTIVGLFTISAVLVRPFFGNLLDRRSRRSILITGIVILLVSVLAHTLAFFIAILLVLRVAHGVGWGASTTASATIASDLVPADKRAEGMGYYGVASTIAMAIGPALGLYLIGSGNFKILFFSSAIIAALGLAGAFFLNYEKKLQIAKAARVQATRGVIIERTALPPSLVLLFVTVTYGGIMTFIPLYANTRGVENIGLFFTVYAVVLLVSRPLIGRLADRFGGYKFVAPGILLVAAALLLLGQARSLPLFLISGVVYGIGFATVQPVLNAAMISLAPIERRGAANATFSVAMDLGIGLGSIILGLVVQNAGYAFMYGSSAIFALAALIVYFSVLHKKLIKVNTEEK
jgi:MFS family permease